jgi:hypothetical protein
MLACARLLEGDGSDFREVEAIEAHVLGNPLAPRTRATVHQFAAEIRGRRDPAGALDHLDQCVALPFFDLEWIELCPALDGLRDTPRFLAAQRRVRDRVAVVWR